MMSHIVQCKKLNKAAEGLEAPPIAGELGQRLYDEISKEAWQLWLKQQTILINENRLKMSDPTARTFLKAEMQKFLYPAPSRIDESPLNTV
jgi:Fe-S cluster biosynthesis and repair protein YggX